MALNVTAYPRLFDFNGSALADPNAELTPEQVQSYYANIYPELVNGSISGPVMSGANVRYTFNTHIGLKG